LPPSWDDVLAEVVGRCRVRRILVQLLQQEARVEDVDPHGGQRAIRLLGFLGELGDALSRVGAHDAKAENFFRR
jgi:hypothetical protein